MFKLLKKFKRNIYTRKIKLECKNYGEDLKVNGKSKVTKKTTLGNNVNFNGITISGCGEVFIGNNFHSGVECLILTEIHNYKGTKIPYDDTYICKNIYIGDNVWLGSRVIILAGVRLGEGSIIQAGSVVVNDIPNYAIAGGHPAKVFNYRDKMHYEELKAKREFH